MNKILHYSSEDIEELIKNTPNLKEFKFNDNRFEPMEPCFASAFKNSKIQVFHNRGSLCYDSELDKLVEALKGNEFIEELDFYAFPSRTSKIATDFFQTLPNLRNLTCFSTYFLFIFHRHCGFKMVFRILSSTHLLQFENFRFK